MGSYRIPYDDEIISQSLDEKEDVNIFSGNFCINPTPSNDI